MIQSFECVYFGSLSSILSSGNILSKLIITVLTFQGKPELNQIRDLGKITEEYEANPTTVNLLVIIFARLLTAIGSINTHFVKLLCILLYYKSIWPLQTYKNEKCLDYGSVPMDSRLNVIQVNIYCCEYVGPTGKIH